MQKLYLMKNSSLFLSILIVCLIACGKKAEPNAGLVSKDTSQVVVKIDSLLFEVDTFHVIEKETGCNEKAGECSVCDLYCEKIKIPLLPVHDSVNRYIDTMMVYAMSDIGYNGGKIDLKAIARNFIVLAIDPENAEFGTWDWNYSSTVIRPVHEIISVSTNYGGYTGGAHGNYYMETTNFYTSTGKRVTMDNLFTDVKAVSKIALRYFKTGNGLEAGVDLAEQTFDVSDEEFMLNDNFDITTESITWQFNSYEIGSYAMGAPSVKVPMKDIEKWMKVKFTDVVIK
jgi:hypothetical protein